MTLRGAIGVSNIDLQENLGKTSAKHDAKMRQK